MSELNSNSQLQDASHGVGPRPIVQAGDPILRARALPVDVNRIGTPEIQELIDSMVVTMREAPGVGLAAPQIGVGLQIIVLEDHESLIRARLTEAERHVKERNGVPLTVIINPTLRVVSDASGANARATFFEGCLSVAGFMALVERDLEVEVEGLDRNGRPLKLRARGWAARILQHEIDHVMGTLYIDRMVSRSFCSMDQYSAHWKDHSVDEIRGILAR